MRSDVIVIGGGVIGAAIAFGLARSGAKVCVLDGSDTSHRAARGNFGLTWVQTKGLGSTPYHQINKLSVDHWEQFDQALQETTGIDVAFQRCGGLVLCLGKDEAETRKSFISQLKKQIGPDRYDCRFLERSALQDKFPAIKIGAQVTGATFSKLDGHVNPLFLLRALIKGIGAHNGAFHAKQAVERISKSGTGYAVSSRSTTYYADKVVIAAGLATGRLARLLGLNVPVRPQKGQIIVTERTHPIFPMPMSGLRQTGEGTIMIGATQENTGFSTTTSISGLGHIIRRAVMSFPALANLRVIRSWGALRILTPDKLPIYSQPLTHPGIFIATSHSGVTLAALHANLFPEWVLEDRFPSCLSTFNLERFDNVHSAA